MIHYYNRKKVTITFRGVTVTGFVDGDLFVKDERLPPLNPIGPNGSRRRGRNASYRYFAALLRRGAP